MKPKGGIEGLCQAISENWDYLFVRPRRLIENRKREERRLCEQVLHNEYTARAVSLLSLCLNPSFDFFETPTVDDMMKFITEKPTQILKHLRAESSQAVSCLIFRIHQQLDLLADVLVKTMILDPTLHMVFAKSTFPALFGFFTTRLFLEMGCELIVMLKERQCVAMLVNEMVKSVFEHAHGFWHAVWYHLVENDIQEETTSEQLWKLLFGRMKDEVHRLSQQHALILREYANGYGQSDAIELLGDIIRESLLLRGRFGPKLLNDLEGQTLIESLEIMEEDLAPLFELFAEEKEYLSDLPDIPRGVVMRVPFLFSDRDLHTLCEIVGMESHIVMESKRLLNEKDAAYRRGYYPFYVDIPILHRDIPNVPTIPERVKYESTVNDRKINELENKAVNMNVSCLEFLEATPFFNPTLGLRVSNLKLTELILERQFMNYENDIEVMNGFCSVRFNDSKMKRWNDFVFETYDCLVDQYVQALAQKVITKLPKIGMVKAVIKALNDSPLAAQLVIATLKAFPMKQNRKEMKFVSEVASALQQPIAKQAGKWLKTDVARGFDRNPDIGLMKLIRVAQLDPELIPSLFRELGPEKFLRFVLKFEKYIYGNANIKNIIDQAFSSEIQLIHGHIQNLLRECPSINVCK